MEVSSKMAKSLTGDVGTLKLPSNDLDCSWSLVQQRPSQLQQLRGSTGSAGAGTCAPEWRSFFHKEKARHFQRQHCACETPTMFQEESTISFKFSLSVCTSQSKTLFFHDSARDFVLLSSHEKQTKKPIKPRAFFPPHISANPIHQSALQKLSTVPADFSLPQCCST